MTQHKIVGGSKKFLTLANRKNSKPEAEARLRAGL